MDNNYGSATVLIIDDMPENLDLLSDVLSGHYMIRAAISGSRGLKIAMQNPPDIILLDVMMPEMDGYEVCRRLKEDPRTRNIPVIFITAVNDMENEERGFAMGAVDYITKPMSTSTVLARIKTHLDLYNQNRTLEKKVRERTRELDKSRLEIIRRLGRAAEYRDNETGLHVIRMSYYSRIIAEEIGMNEAEADMVLNAAPMHDIGKIGIPDSILLKPGPLDPDEMKLMQKHSEIGAGIIGLHENELLKAAHAAALTHHEKWNGRGYPAGLSGENIPLIGRIVAIADAFDALTSRRPYKPAWPVERAVELLEKEAGIHFDPALVPAMLRNMDRVLEIKERHADSE
jgi:putative two-component system response regulator